MNNHQISAPNHSIIEKRIPDIINDLIEWFRLYGRDLPWRHTRDPYQILISEIMLQQTNVDLVIPIYKRFLKKFPTIQSLARSKISRIRAITDQLGYKRRGLYLQQIARQIVSEKGGIIPNTLEGLISLKGIGRYTAGAILSFAYELQDKAAAIVDVNVERIIIRLFALWNREKNAALEKEIWMIAENITVSSKDSWTINQGLLDLGATICVSQKPKCHICPIRTFCEYYIQIIPKLVPLESFFS
ncbi:MAG: A/G-specific adenine glycosylase [Candidatus Heimdallarchaeota archaeon]